MKFLPGRHKISLNPSTHIAYFPYEMVVVQNSVALHSSVKRVYHSQIKPIQPFIHPASYQPNNYNQTLDTNNSPGKTNRVRNLLKGTLAEHLYNLFTAPVE